MHNTSEATCSSKQFGLFRIILGLYLAVHLTMTAFHYDDFLWPLFLSPPSTPASFWLFPIGILLSLFFTLGIYRKVSALGIWIILRFLVYKNIYYYGMNLDYVGFLLLLTLFIPTGEALSIQKQDLNWQMPRAVYFGAWLVFTLSMTMSGLNKFLISPEWRSGETIQILFTQSAAYHSETIKSFILSFPLFFKFLTWLTLILEIISVFIIFNRRLRYYYSISTFFIFASVSLFLTMSEVGFSVIIFEILLFDSHFWKYQHA